MIARLVTYLLFGLGLLVSVTALTWVASDVAALFADAGTGWALLALAPGVLLAAWAFLLAPPPG